MPTFSHTQSEQMLARTSVSKPKTCYPRSDLYEWVITSRQNKSWNEVQHRKKPPAPLHDHVTSLAKQYTYTASHCRRGTEQAHALTCGQRIDTFYDSMTPALQFTDKIPTRKDWVMLMRERIEENNVSLGETLAEYKQAARMFGSFAKKLHKFYRIMRFKGTRRKPLRVCSIANAELMYSYGIAPLAGVLYDSVEQLRIRMKKPLVQRYYVKSEQEYDGSGEYSGVYHEYKCKRVQKANVYMTLKDIDYWRSYINIGNPVEWAWELIPFSFVVDWALPIGRWLGTFDSLKGSKSLIGTVSTKDSIESKYNLVTNSDQFTEFQGHSSYSSFEREVIDEIPLPSFPKFDISYSWRRVMHGTSLLTVLNKRCRPR